MPRDAANRSKLAVILDQITAEIDQRVPRDKMHHVRYFPFYDQISHRFPVFLTISKLPGIVPFYLCNRGLKFIGFKEKQSKLEKYLMQSMEQFVHPENMYIVQRRISHFYKTPAQDFAIAYQVKAAEYGWQWIYGLSRFMPTAPDKSVGYIITVARDIEGMLNNTLFSGAFSGPGFSPVEEARVRSLSAREKQILQMYSLGKKNGDVSKLLGISPQTLQTHRKNIYKKLQISNSAGLVRYALLLGNK